MKKLLCIFAFFCLLTACGAVSVSEAQAISENMEIYTEEELFLQDAYWYLQSDEKNILTWENGTVEDFCTEGDLYVMGPLGEVNIKNLRLRRVYYPIWSISENLYETADLYFEPDGTFVGMGHQLYMEGNSSPRDGAYWDGDISFWVFLDRPAAAENESLTVTCILKDTEGTGATYQAAAPYYAEIEIYKDGVQLTSGLDASAQYLNFSLEPVAMEEHTIHLDNVTAMARERGVDPTGEYNVRVTAYLEEVRDEQRCTQFSLNRYVSFTVE